MMRLLFLHLCLIRAFALLSMIRPERISCKLAVKATSDGITSVVGPSSESARLSHVMLKVSSVDDAITYWAEKGGNILASRKDEKTGKYLSAFVALGNGKTTENAFALELIRTDNCELGNIVNYIGISLLLQFQGNLEGLISGASKAKPPGPEPNGIPVKSCASSPGDFLCRLCLKSNNLEATKEFYEDVLGMEVAAADESQLCMRYMDDSVSSKDFGVPTVLVFEGTNEKLVYGNCMDHLAIKTTDSIGKLFEELKQADATIFMNPTEMFGSTVMGLRDPNGYKVVLAGPA